MPENMKSNIQAALAQVQSEVLVRKDEVNHFGNYRYRTAEGILRAAKPACKKNGIMLTLSEEVKMVGERYYIVSTATATLIEDPAQKVSVSTAAREPEHRSGSDEAQLTGASVSYARKYALCGLLAIDDGQSDPDVSNKHGKDTVPPPEQSNAGTCSECGAPIIDVQVGDVLRKAEWISSKSTQFYGKPLCGKCMSAHRRAEKEQGKQA